jgi:hypothetical protein
MGALRGLSLPVFRAIVAAELERDKAIIEKMPQDEAALQWFQLNRFDRPLVATRRLMERHYSPSGQMAACFPPSTEVPATFVRLREEEELSA